MTSYEALNPPAVFTNRVRFSAFINSEFQETKFLRFFPSNLILQLTGAVRWTQTIEAMIAGGASSFTEVGPGTVLQGLVKKVDRQIPTSSASILTA